MKKGLLGLLLFAMAQTSGAQSPASQQTAEQGKSVVLYEARGPGRYRSTYRIAVFSDGLVIYEGLGLVKHVGVSQFNVTRQTVDKLVADLKAAGILSYKPPTGIRTTEDYLDIHLHVDSSGIATSSRFDSESVFGMTIGDVIEQHIPTRDLRCPHFIDLGRQPLYELCAARDERKRRYLGQGTK
jgi:hypothetical protein